MNIERASDKLYNDLRQYDEVVGTGIQEDKHKSYIIVYLERFTKAIQNKIPKEFHGNQVRTKVSGNFFM